MTCFCVDDNKFGMYGQGKKIKTRWWTCSFFVVVSYIKGVVLCEHYEWAFRWPILGKIYKKAICKGDQQK